MERMTLITSLIFIFLATQILKQTDQVINVYGGYVHVCTYLHVHDILHN
jgi:hypothetical protein